MPGTFLVSVAVTSIWCSQSSPTAQCRPGSRRKRDDAQRSGQLVRKVGPSGTKTSEPGPSRPMARPDCGTAGSARTIAPDEASTQANASRPNRRRPHAGCQGRKSTAYTAAGRSSCVILRSIPPNVFCQPAVLGRRASGYSLGHDLLDVFSQARVELVRVYRQLPRGVQAAARRDPAAVRADGDAEHAAGQRGLAGESSWHRRQSVAPV